MLDAWKFVVLNRFESWKVEGWNRGWHWVLALVEVIVLHRLHLFIVFLWNIWKLWGSFLLQRHLSSVSNFATWPAFGCWLWSLLIAHSWILYHAPSLVELSNLNTDIISVNVWVIFVIYLHIRQFLFVLSLVVKPRSLNWYLTRFLSC